MVNCIAHLENNYSNFNALKFCQEFSITCKKDAISVFSPSINQIARRNLRAKSANKTLITWARKANNRAELDRLFSTVPLNQYFYSQNRKLLLTKQKNYYVNVQHQVVDDLTGEDERSDDRETIEKTSVETEENIENFGNHSYINTLKQEFEKEYRKMNDNNKWYLSTNKCVEDELYYYGMQCTNEHQVHSFIIDTSDNNLRLYGVFNDDELEEIKQYKQKPAPTMPIDLRCYLNSFNRNSTKEIRQQIFRPMDFDVDFDPKKSFDFDWIRNSVYNLVMEYEAESLKVPHHEEWFKSHIWNFTDTVFNHSVVEVDRGEVTSSSSCIRKNKDRSSPGILLIRKTMGTKCDMIFKEKGFINEDSREYGATECGRKYEGPNGTKIINEGYLKLPKTLKDMIDNLFSLYPDAPTDKIETVGYIQTGLFCQALRVDRPSAYVTRVTRFEPCIINSDALCFGESVTRALYMSYAIRDIVLSVQKSLRTTQNAQSRSQDSSWLETCLKRKTCSDLIPAPQTSTSDRTKRRSVKD